jgi:phosphatidylserine/phosphatidylglycerophosphate/cardiolipin synthase-like enzyme
MKSQQAIFRLVALVIILFMLMSLAVVSPSVSAQAENTLTPTPFEPVLTPEPPPVLEIQEENGFQVLGGMQAQSLLPGEAWSPQTNISNTLEESVKARIATDRNWVQHIVWREVVGGKQDIFYSRIDRGIQSTPVNVSNSASFHSDFPQLVVDSTGTAHIVWQEEDNDQADDHEIHYSQCNETGCTSPFTLSDGLPCGIYPGDWKAITPSIGIDLNDELMVVWMSYEPNPVTHTMYSYWPASGIPPSNRTGCQNSSGLFANPMVAGDSNGDFHLVMMSYDFNIFYSSFTNGSWSANQNLGSGFIPVVHVDQYDNVHAAWQNDNAPPEYSIKEVDSSTWSTAEDVFSSMACSDLSLITDGRHWPRLTCVAGGFLYEASRESDSVGWSEPESIAGNDGTTSQPHMVKDMSGILHLVWSDFRDGNWEIYYSPSYSCEGIEPATAAGQAVLSVLEGDEDNIEPLNYCKNKVQGAIFVPALAGSTDPNEAFQQWADLAGSATHEVAFTVMYWSKEDDGKTQQGRPNPGKLVLQGVDSLYDAFKNEETTVNYPNGMTVRILLGVEINALEPPQIDQRHFVLEQLRDLGIPLYELYDGRIWKVEVGLYNYDFEEHSHVKLMVVDSNEMIVSGYHPQYSFQTVGSNANFDDLGIRISGPVAANAMAIFDSLWAGSKVLCAGQDISQITNWETCGDPSDGVNPPHWVFTPVEDDIVLPLYRDHDRKTADHAVHAAIQTADTQVYAMQNRFLVLPVLGYVEPGLLEYADAIIEAADHAEIRIILSSDYPNGKINMFSVRNFYKRVGAGVESDMVRFYPGDLTDRTEGVHTKSFMVDGEFLVIGSQNFDASAFGSSSLDLDLVEYSVGIEDIDTVANVKAHFDLIWDNSIAPLAINNEDSFKQSVEQAGAGSIIIVEAGSYEIADTVNIPDGVTIFGAGATLEPASTFSNGNMLSINGDNVVILGLTIQDSPGHAVEIGDGSSSFENVYLSGMVFANNADGDVHVQSPASGIADFVVENNTFVGSDYGIIIDADATTTGTVRDNILAAQNFAPVQIVSADSGNVEYGYNLFHDCAGGSCSANWVSGNLGSGASVHDNLFDLDPQFVNSAGDDYQLSATSPAIDAGDPQVLHELVIDGDGDGEPRIDMGAFEYSSIVLPEVEMVVRASPNPTAAENVDFTVTFSESVTGVDASDFTLTTTGVSGASVGAVSGSGATYTVTVNTGTGDGTIRLDVAGDGTIIGVSTYPFNGWFTDGEIYTVDKTQPWNTFLGSSGDDFSFGMDTDGDGNTYVTGYGNAAWGNPIRAYSNNNDVFVAKVDPSGALVWNTFLGGSEWDIVQSITVGDDGNIYVSGQSDTTWGSPVRGYSGDMDGFVAKLDPSGALLWNTFEGGSGSDRALGISADENGNVYLSGNSNATWGSPLDPYAGLNDAFVAKLDSSGALVWNTFLGENGDDVGYNIVLDESDNIYLSGYSTATWGSPVRVYSGSGQDAFAARLSSSGVLAWNTFLGGTGTDFGYHITLDESSNVYVTGHSTATWGNSVYAYSSGQDAFAAKLNSSGELSWHTFLGGSGTDSGYSIEVDEDGNIHVAGASSAAWGNPIQPYTSDYDGAVIKLNPAGGLLATTFIGGSGADRAYGMELHGIGNIYLSGISSATWGSPVRAYDSGSDAFAVRLDLEDAPLIVSSVTRAGSPSTAATSVDFVVDFSESVTGVDASDFTLTTTGVSGASITGVSGSGATYTVTVNTGSGNGTIRLDVVDDDSILDGSSDPLNGGFTSGQTYTIDRTAPTVVSSVRGPVDPTAVSQVNFIVTFSEPVTGVDAADFDPFTPFPPTTFDADITNVSGSGSVYVVTVAVDLRLSHQAAASAWVELEVQDNDTIVDLASNPLGGSGSGNGSFDNGQTFTIAALPFISTAAQDGWALESGENTGAGGSVNASATTFNLGDDALDKQYRALLHFNTSTLPDTSVVIDTKLILRQIAIQGTDPFTTLGTLTLDMQTPHFGTAASLAAHDFQAVSGYPAVATFLDDEVAYLNATAFPFINRTGNTQFRLAFTLDDDDDMSADYVTFASGSHATATSRPTFYVVYFVP